LSTECSSLTMKLANCQTTHLSFPLSWYLDRRIKLRTLVGYLKCIQMES